MKSVLRRSGLALGLGLWLVAGAVGLARLGHYRFVSGPVETAPAGLPAVLRVPNARPGPTLVMAVHPCCPCSRATLAELAKILTHCPDSCRLVVLAFKPTDEPVSWTESGVVEQARRLSAEIRMDEDGALARQLGLLTSGQVLLYDAAGTLRFQGGITAGRGHEGDNAGQSTVERILRGEPVPVTRLPVYGCSLVTQ